MFFLSSVDVAGIIARRLGDGFNVLEEVEGSRFKVGRFKELGGAIFVMEVIAGLAAFV